MQRPAMVPLALLLLAAWVTCCAAGSFGPGGLYRPQVPVSAFALPASWLDPSRLHVSAELMMGSGSGRQGVEGLQVTRLNYRIADPLAVRVSLGTAFGREAAASGSSMFLEGLDLSYRPFRSLLVQLHYQDIRSPLQLSRPGPYEPRR